MSWYLSLKGLFMGVELLDRTADRTLTAELNRTTRWVVTNECIRMAVFVHLLPTKDHFA